MRTFLLIIFGNANADSSTHQRFLAAFDNVNDDFRLPIAGINLGRTDVPGKRCLEIDENPPNLTHDGLMVLAVGPWSRP